MSNGKKPPVSDKELWRRVAIERPPETGVTGSDANLIAALAEGRLSEDEHAALEARMVASPVVREAVRMVRDDPRLEEPVRPPAALTARAKAAFDAEHAPRARRARTGWLAAGLQWAGAAACFVLVAYIGFALGSETRIDAARTEALVRSELALGLGTGDDRLVMTTLSGERRGGGLR